MTDWVRLWHDMPTDPKWRVVARKSGQPVATVIAVFTLMLVEASRAVERGALISFSVEDAAAALDEDEAAIAAVFEAMRGRVHDGERLTGWERRQPKREDLTATERKAEQRRREQGAVSSANVRPARPPDLFATAPEEGASRTVTQRHAPESESEPDSDSRNDTGLAPANVRIPTADELAALRAALTQAAGACLAELSDAPGLQDLSPILGLMGPGLGPPCDVERHILPAIANCGARTAPGVVRSWRYYLGPIVDYRNAVEAGAPPLQPPNLEISNGRPRPHLHRGAGARADRRDAIAQVVADELAHGARAAS